MRSVAAVVVTYNRREQLRRNLQALFSQTVACDVILVDNAGTDGTAEMIETCFSAKVRYYNTGTNLGGAGGFAFGLKKAVEAGYDCAWLMDDDTVPEKDSLEMLLRADRALQGKWGILSGVARWKDGSICRANRQKKTLFTFVKDEELKNRKLLRVQMVSMVSLLVRTGVVRELGLPKSEYFIWSDDYDFSGRISKHYPVYVVTGSEVRHEMSENKKADIALEQGERIERYRCLFRNDVDCYRQFGAKGWVYILLKDIWATGRVLLLAKREKGKRIRMIWGGFAEGLRFRPKIGRVS